MLLRCAKLQPLSKVIRLLRSGHFGVRDDDPPAIENLHRARLPADAYQRRPSGMRSYSDGCAFHVRLCERRVKLFSIVNVVSVSDPASSAPSRSSVRQEMTSPGPKQPQLISIPFAYAPIIRPKNTSNSSEVATVDTRIQRPAMSSTPISNSSHGSVRATLSTAHTATNVNKSI